MPASEARQAGATTQLAAANNTAPKPTPQLIRTASVSLLVADTEAALRQLDDLVRAQQGDILNIEDASPRQSGQPRTAQAEVRVPQARFAPTLEALAQLGQVQTRTVSAQDVSDQIVDYQARLRNLRRTEQSILKIMDRSGNIEQVLRVTQELGNVRGQIEQIDAQLKAVQNQVAYAHIRVNFETIASSAGVERSVGVRLAETWKSATRSMQDFSVGLLAAGLWLVAYSPYLLLSGAALAFAISRLRPRHTPPPPAA